MKNRVGVRAAWAAMGSRPIRRTLLSSAVLAALGTMTAHAQDAAKPPVEQLEAVIVTGTARSEGLKKLDASFSITTASNEQIKDAAPASSADLLKIVPGVMVETTGGQTGNNIEIRGFAATGDAPWVTFQLNGAVMYPVPTLSFFEGSSMFRLDDTIERVEVLRGGPAPIFGDGQPGATVNFIQKKGSDIPEGGLRMTLGSGSQRRVDGFYAGKIAEGWYTSFGGFFRTSQGIRDTDFPADRGGQFNAMLTRKLDDGELSVYGRWLNDKNTFYLPIPLQSSNGGKSLSSFPGFPAQTATFIGNELRLVSAEAYPAAPGGTPGTLDFDMADGRGAEVHLYGMNLDKKMGAWTISNKANYLTATMPTYAWFTGANPQTAADFIEANGAAAGSATYVNGGGAVADDQQLLSVGAWAVVKELQSFTNDFRISRNLTDNNTLTLGAWFADYSADDRWSLGNNFLTTLDPSGGRLVNVAGITSPTGQLSGSFFSLKESFNGQQLAAFLADEWAPTEELRVDGGVRVEQRRVNGTWENASPQDLDQDPSTLYNNNVSVLNGTYSNISRSERKASWTAGVNYYVTPAVSVFGRINSGYQFQHFDNLRGNANVPSALEPATVKQYELGLKTDNKLYSAFVTGFYNDFKGLNFLQILTTGPVNTTAGSRSKGIEAEVAVRPLPGLEFALSGNYLKANYTNYFVAEGDDRTGNQVIRQPKLQFRFTPSYRFHTDLGTVKLWSTYSYIGERYNDDQNLQILPKYDTIDAGIVAHLNNGIDLRFTGTNLTNEIGITEGNTRVQGDATTNGVFMGRPIFGRAYEVSVGFNF
jgi:outer membrane receptor protein involved in Fe transport